MQEYTTPFKTHSVPFKANGVFFGVVAAVDGKRLDIKVPRMTGDAVFKNIEYADSGFSTVPLAGELVLVAFLEGKKDDLVVLGRVKSSLEYPDIDFTGVSAGDFIQYDGSKFVAAPIDLGSLTVGNYVATITGTANEIDVTGSGTESAAVTLSLPATINADTTGSAARWTNSRTITLGGDLSGSVSIDGSANATLTATANSASKWTTARTITLGGDLSGSVSIDGSANETLTATIGANSVALGTDTTGDYVSTITAGTGVSISSGAGTGEGSTPTLAIGQGVATSDSPSFSTITSTVATGTAPLTVASTTLVSNLNADLLDGQHASFYVPSGSIQQYAGLSTPSGWLLCNGQSVSRTTYVDLFTALTVSKGTATMTIATPCVVTLTSHGFVAGDAIYFTTTGALPTGLSADTTYYVQNPAANTFNLNTTQSNAIANSGTGRINTSGSQSGTHTVVHSPWGGITASNFAIPDLRGRVGVGMDNMGGSDAGRLSVNNALGLDGGAETHTLTIAEMPAHTHSTGQAVSGAGLIAFTGGGSSFTTTSGSTGGGGAHNNMQPYILLNYIIKT